MGAAMTILSNGDSAMQMRWSAARAKNVRQTPDASEEIGALLLKGWTMLADHCAQCQTPLMSLRGGQPKCVLCDAQNKLKSKTLKKTEVKETPPTTAPLRALGNGAVMGNGVSVPEPISKRKSEAPKQQTQSNFERDRYGDRRRDTDRAWKDDRYERERDDYYGEEYYAPPPPPYHYGRHHGPHFGRRGRGRHGGRGRHRHCGPMNGPPRFFGFGPRTDERMERTMGDAVNAVLAKIEAINERMQRGRGSVLADAQEMNQLTDFLLKVQKLKNCASE